MWVELIGLPGAGKTTLIENNISIISEQYTIIKSNRSNIFQKIITKLLYWFYYGLKLDDKNLAKKLAYRHGFRFGIKQSQRTFFYDSGVTQVILENIIETNFKNIDKKLQILSEMPQSHKIIYLKDNLEEIAKREVNRPKSRFNLTLEETIIRYQQAQEIIEKQLLHSGAIIDTISSENTDDLIKAIQSEKIS